MRRLAFTGISSTLLAVCIVVQAQDGPPFDTTLISEDIVGVCLLQFKRAVTKRCYASLNLTRTAFGPSELIEKYGLVQLFTSDTERKLRALNAGVSHGDASARELAKSYVRLQSRNALADLCSLARYWNNDIWTVDGSRLSCVAEVLSDQGLTACASDGNSIKGLSELIDNVQHTWLAYYQTCSRHSFYQCWLNASSVCGLPGHSLDGSDICFDARLFVEILECSSQIRKWCSTKANETEISFIARFAGEIENEFTSTYNLTPATVLTVCEEIDTCYAAYKTTLIKDFFNCHNNFNITKLRKNVSSNADQRLAPSQLNETCLALKKSEACIRKICSPVWCERLSILTGGILFIPRSICIGHEKFYYNDEAKVEDLVRSGF